MAALLVVVSVMAALALLSWTGKVRQKAWDDPVPTARKVLDAYLAAETKHDAQGMLPYLNGDAPRFRYGDAEVQGQTVLKTQRIGGLYAVLFQVETHLREKDSGRKSVRHTWYVVADTLMNGYQVTDIIAQE